MSNLLDKSSVLLTPTAYDNGKILSVKPNTSVGDFNFTRNSSATRVNSQGLIEDMQILSGDLISNGDFSQEGSQLVTNGDFATDSNWTKQASWSISGGAANYDFLSDAKYIRQTLLSGGFVAGKSYKINFEITSGTAYMYVSSNAAGLISLNTYSVGSYSIYVTASASGSDLLIYGRNTSGTAFSIDNVSVKEVGQDWTLGTGWSIGEDKAVSDGLSNYENIYQTVSPNLVVGNKYLVSFGLTVTSGALRIRTDVGTYYPNVFNTSGNQSIELTLTNGSDFWFNSYSGFNGSITNIKIIEITSDTNLPRIDYTGGEGHWLFEPQSTNLITQSELFSDSYWTKSGTSITPNATTSPDGTTNADNLVEDSANSQHYLQRNFTSTNGSSYTYKIYVKMNGRRNISLRENGSTGYYVSFDLLNGVILEQSNATGTIKELTNGWFEITHTSVAGNSFNVAYYLLSDSYTSGNPQTSPYQGDGVSGFYIWGAMLEQNSFSTSYIPTSGAISTRLQDAAFGAGSSDLINSTEGVLYAEIAALANDGTNRVISLSKDAGNRVNILYRNGSNRMRFIVRINNVNVFDTSITLSGIVNYNKVALSFKENQFKAFVNGVKEVEQLSGSIYPINTLDKLNFDQVSGAQPFYGRTKCAAVFKEALTDTELTCLTTI